MNPSDTQYCVIALIAVLVYVAAIGWAISQKDEDATRNRGNSKAEFEKKEANLKAIYANMAEFDKVVEERSAAIKAGDMELYKAKDRELIEVRKRGDILFKD